MARSDGFKRRKFETRKGIEELEEGPRIQRAKEQIELEGLAKKTQTEHIEKAKSAGIPKELKKETPSGKIEEQSKETFADHMKHIGTELNTIIHEANVYGQDKKAVFSKKLKKIQEESHNFSKMTFTEVQRNVKDAIKLIQEDFRKVDIELYYLPVSLKDRMLKLMEEIIQRNVKDAIKLI